MLAKKILNSIPQSIRMIRHLSVCFMGNELTIQQFRILTLCKEGMGQTQMAQTLQISMAAISKMVDHLVKQNLLERHQGDDRRCLKLSLTPEGKKIQKKITGQVEKILNKNLEKLTNEEQVDLDRGLTVLDKLMGFVNEK